MAWYSSILSPIVDGIGGYFKDKQQIKAAKALRKDELLAAKHFAEVDRVKRGDVAETSYDRIALENRKNSMMDEVLILWTLGIVTLLFIPATAPYAITGFKVLATQIPVFFQLIFIGCFCSTLGLRFLFRGRSILGSIVK